MVSPRWHPTLIQFFTIYCYTHLELNYIPIIICYHHGGVFERAWSFWACMKFWCISLLSVKMTLLCILLITWTFSCQTYNISYESKCGPYAVWNFFGTRMKVKDMLCNILWGILASQYFHNFSRADLTHYLWDIEKFRKTKY